MATNFAGLGFSFFAKDGGLSRVMQGVSNQMDGMAAGIRGFSAAAEKASQPVDDFVQSLSGKAFQGAADGAQRVTDAIETGVVNAVVKGSQVMEDAQGVFREGGENMSASFANLKNSAKGMLQNLAGDRFKKIAKQIPTQQFKAMGDQMKATWGVAKGFVGQLFGVKQGLGEVDKQATTVADSFGRKLPKGTQQASEKFKRSSNEIASGESQISRGFGDITRMADKAGSAFAKVGGLGKKFLDAMPAKRVMGLAQQIAHVGTAGGQLTTSFEAAAQQASVDGRKAVAAYGIFGQALNKASGEAAGLIMGMKTSGQTAGAAVASFKQYSSVLKAVGIDSAAAGVKLEDGMGIPIRETTMQLHRLQTNLKLSDKELGDLTKTFTAAGETIGDMKAPFGRMDEMLAIAERRSNLVAQGMSSIGGADSVKSINRATQSLFLLTGNAKGAQDTAMSLESTMVNAMEGFRNMFTGTSDELDQFLVGTSIVTGDVQQAFEAAKDGPDAFIKKFGGVIAQLKKGGKSTDDIMKFFGGQMSKAMDPEAANQLVTALSNIDDQKLKLINGAKTMGKSLGELGKESWRSSMTMQESFDLMMGAAESRFRNIGRQAAVTFMGDTKKAFDSFNNQAEKLVKEGGPLGAMVNKMSEISSLGAKALLPEALRPMAQIFGHLGPEVFQAVSAFASLAPALMALLNPLTIVLGAFTLLHLGFKQSEARMKSQDKGYQALTKSLDGYNKELKNTKQGTAKYAQLTTKIADAEKKRASMEEVIREASRKQFIEDLKTRAAKYYEAAKNFIKGLGPFLKEVGKELKAFFQGVDWKAMLSTLWEDIKSLFSNIPWADIFKAISKADTAIKKALVDLFNKGLDALEKIDWKGSGDTLKKGFEKAWPVVKQIFEEKLELLKTSVLPALERLGKLIVEGLKTIPPKLGEALKEFAPVAKEAMKNFVPIFLDAVEKAVKYAIEALLAWGKQLPDIIRGFGKFLSAAVGFIGDVVIGILEGVRDWLAKKFPTLAGPITAVFNYMRDSFQRSIDAIKLGIKIVAEVFAWVEEQIFKVWNYLFGNSIVPDFFKDAIDFITGVLHGFIDTFIQRFNTFADLIGTGINTARDMIVGAWETVKGVFAGFFDWIEQKVRSFFGNSIIVDMFKTGFDEITGIFDKFWNFAKSIFEKVSGFVSTMFSPVTKIIDKIFGGGGDSVGAMVAGGMDKALEVIKGVVTQVTALVQKSLYDAIVDGLTSAFVQAFQLVAKSTTKFFELQTNAFKKFLEGILMMFRNSWMKILDETDLASQALSQTIAGSLADLEKLKAALAAAQAARAAAASAAAESGKVGERMKAETDGDKYKEQILNQTATPKWYTDMYEPLFKTGVKEIVDAVKGIQSSAAAGGNRSAAAAARANLQGRPQGIPGNPLNNTEQGG